MAKMFTSNSILQESGTLQALLKIISDPAAVKAQVDELEASAKIASEATDKLVQEKVELQNVRLQAEQVVMDAGDVSEGVGKAIGRAQGVVNDALIQKMQLEAQGKAALVEARDLVQQMATGAQAALELYQEARAEREAKIAELDKEIADREARLSRVNEQLDELRSKLGLTV
jgi:chromosome segregation ATPase